MRNNKEKQTNPSVSQIQFGLKSFLTVCGILIGVMLVVGILTFIIPAGEYNDGKFTAIESTTRLPVWRWITSPIEAIIRGEGNFNIIQVIIVLLVLGGTFMVLDRTGGLYATVSLVVDKFFNKRYLAIWIITLVMMLLSSCFGLQEELLILFPLFLSFCKAMNWSKLQAISLVLITTGVGFTVALFNPFTIGLATSTSQTPVSILDGLWFRIMLFVVFYFITCLYLIRMAKKDEKKNKDKPLINQFASLPKEVKDEFKKKTKMILILFGSALGVIILASAIPFIAELGIGMVLMAVVFVIGSFIIGAKLLGGAKTTFSCFFKGVKTLAPSVVVVMLAFSVKYIAEQGQILDTLFFYCYTFLCSQPPFVAVIILYLIILVFEFFIPSTSAKVSLLIPLLTLAPIPGLSINVIILTFLFADGYTNVLFPTCGTLVIGISLAEVGYLEWLKRTGLFQILLFVVSSAFLILAIYIGL
ncbi:MAG: hypothetical protein E7348_01560 [Clostridiales bacterium]|nr:hypothetical protein [Clostridiales bacterium]